ncbi:MAG: bifunctional oligoribonuclease/PAP phosphatase NrnA [Thermoanaerobaculia bacterium]
MNNLISFLKKKNSFLILSHQHPDGDSVGSALALKCILEKLGKRARIVNTDPLPFNLRKIQGKEHWEIMEKLPGDFPSSYDGTFVLECPSLERTGYSNIKDIPLINLDHHISNQKYGDYVIVRPEIPCIGIIIFEIAKNLDIKITEEMANYLYISLVTDTGQFCYANSTPQAFDFASQLVSFGAKPDEVSKLLYENYPASSVKLKGLLLSTLEIEKDGKVAILKFPLCFLKETNSLPQDAEGVIDEPRKIEGVEVAVMLREEEGGNIKISMRSQGNIDVERIARKYDGGGHKNAAGFTIKGNFIEAKNLILKEIGESL